MGVWTTRTQNFGNARLREHYKEGEIVELLGVISLLGFLNRWNDSMGTTLEPGAVALGQQQLAAQGWGVGKHASEGS